MIWHFVEVWLLVTLMFVVGCLAGAWLYGVVGETRLATAQGVFADSVGDVLDRIKVRLGMAPAWRPMHLRGIDRHPQGGDEDAAPAGQPSEHRSAATRGEDALRPEVAEPRERSIRLRPAEPDIKPGRDEADKVQRGDLAAPVPAAPRDNVTPKRPAGLATPRGGVPDNLQRIKGIGKRNEALLNRLGIFHFGQIAAWTPGEVRWIGQYLAFPERIERDNWVAQATVLAMGSDTGFEKSAERRRRRRQQEREFRTRMTPVDEQDGVADHDAASAAPSPDDDLAALMDRPLAGRADPLDDFDDPLDPEFDEPDRFDEDDERDPTG